MAIRLYASRDNTGTPLSYNDACSAIPDGWNDKTLSLQTDEGESWQVWTDTNYGGTASPILSGTYDFQALLLYGLVHSDGKGRISSLQKRASSGVSLGGITLFKAQSPGGPSLYVSKATPALPPDWNDATLSCVVSGPPWIVYIDNGFSNSAAVLQIGQHDFNDLARMSMVHSDGKGRISSLRPLLECPQAYWMSRVRGDVLLSDLTIPGTHDSATYSGTMPEEARCQSMGIREQLIAGIRYLDIRCELTGAPKGDLNAKLTIKHGPASANLDLQDIIDDCATFLAACPGECIVFSIKNNDAKADNVQWFVDVINKYIGKNSKLWYVNTGLPMLGDVRGKLVLFRQYDLPDDYVDIDQGLQVDVGWGGSDGNHRDDFTIDCGSWCLRGQDNYYDPAIKWLLVKALLEAAASTPRLPLVAPTPAGVRKTTLFVNYTSAVSWGGFPSATSNLINQYLCDYLRSSPQDARLGIIPMDFPGEAIGQLIAHNLSLAPMLMTLFPARLNLQASNGQFVCAEDGGGGAVVANRDKAAAWETFDVVVVDAARGKIGLKTANGKFLCAEGGGGQKLVANRGTLGAWETFTVRIVDGAKGLISLQASNGQYVQAAGGGGGALQAVGVWAVQWESFKLVVPATLRTTAPGTKIALQASNGLFVCAEGGGGGAVVANRSKAAAWETFEVVTVDAAKGKFGLRASNGNYVSAEGGGGTVVVADRSRLSSWETFVVYQIDSDHIALRASNGQFVQAQNGGGAGVAAISGFTLAWEMFRVVQMS